MRRGRGVFTQKRFTRGLEALQLLPLQIKESVCFPTRNGERQLFVGVAQDTPLHVQEYLDYIDDHELDVLEENKEGDN
jgi:hypothetical protein